MSKSKSDDERQQDSCEEIFFEITSKKTEDLPRIAYLLQQEAKSQ